MFKKSIVHLIRLPGKVNNCMMIGIRHICNVPAIVMNNGNEIPILGLGTWMATSDYAALEKPKDGQKACKAEVSPEELDKAREEMAKSVDIALDVGYRHIDCAHLYNNEKEIGEVINKKIAEGKLKREELFITSKLWNTFHNPDKVCDSLATTLNDLCIDYVDLYLMHTPMGLKEDSGFFPTDEKGNPSFSDIHYCDTWKAMEELVELGLCKNIGISNFNKQQVGTLLQKAKIRPQMLQMELHPYLCQKELVQFVKYNDISVTAYAAVGSGKRPWAGDEKVLLEDYKVLQIAEKHKRTPAQILLRYQIQNGIAVIARSVNKSHIEENINIFNFELCPEDMLNLFSLNHNFRYFQFSGANGHPHHPFET